MNGLKESRHRWCHVDPTPSGIDATPNVKKTYKNTCGAPAPEGILYFPATIPAKSVAVKKISKTAVAGGILSYRASGERLTAGAVSRAVSLFISFFK